VVSRGFRWSGASGDGGPGADLFEFGYTAVGVGDAGASQLARVAGAAGDELAVVLMPQPIPVLTVT
jgi:hypothetical protein